MPFCSMLFGHVPSWNPRMENAFSMAILFQSFQGIRVSSYRSFQWTPPVGKEVEKEQYTVRYSTGWLCCQSPFNSRVEKNNIGYSTIQYSTVLLLLHCSASIIQHSTDWSTKICLQATYMPLLRRHQHWLNLSFGVALSLHQDQQQRTCRLVPECEIQNAKRRSA